MRNKKLLIYGLVDPFKNEIRYIGKSSTGLSRPKSHFREEIYNDKEKGTYCHNWVKKCINLGSKPNIIILNYCLDTEELNQMEKFWIWYLKDILSYKLTNLTLGGDGLPGRKHTEETKKRIGDKNRGRIKSKEEREAIRERMKINNPTKGRKRTLKEIKSTSKYRGQRKIFAYNSIDKSYIGEWELASLCSEALNVSQNDICAVLKGRQKSAKGYVFSSQNQSQL